jgi:hypothetical protein
MARYTFCLMLIAASAALGDISFAASPRWPKWLSDRPPLRAPPEDTITVRTTEELVRELARAKEQATILLADGVYEIDAILVVRAPGMVLRSASGDPAKAVIDAKGCKAGEAVHIHADDVTVAELTIRNARFNGIKLEPERGGHRFVAHGCVFHNVWQRGIKSPLCPAEKSARFPQDGQIRYCLFANDRPKEFADDETDTAATFNGNYIGGIDMKTIAGWTIADNVFVKLQGRTREGRAAVYLADKVDKCIVERNVVLDCDVGLALGNPSRVGDWTHCTRCEVRNNMVTNCPETGVLAVYTEDCRLLHNTIWEPKSRLGRLIWAHQQNDRLLVAGNLLAGSDMRLQGAGEIEHIANIVLEDAKNVFVDPAECNLHLRAADAKLTVKYQKPQTKRDFDGQERTALTAGADEATRAQ